MENLSNTDGAVSLHLYCPPFTQCSVFNKATGKKTKCNVSDKKAISAILFFKYIHILFM